MQDNSIQFIITYTDILVFHTIDTFKLSDITEAFRTRGQIPYSANNPSMEDMKTYLSSSAA